MNYPFRTVEGELVATHSNSSVEHPVEASNVEEAAFDAEGPAFLLFESRGALWGVEARVVREVLLLPEIAPLDGAPRRVGVLDVRGRIVPVVDPGELAGAPRRRFLTSDSVVVIESPGGNGDCLGIIVESVRDVRPLQLDSDHKMTSEAVTGLARVDGEIARLLDVPLLMQFAARETSSVQNAPARAFCPDASPFERAVFQERARALRAGATEEEGASAPTLVALRLGGEVFGLDLEWVREFASRPTVTPVPCAPPDVLGLVNLRGEVVTLLDLRFALGLPVEGDAGAHIAFIECEGVHLGIAVEAVLDVFAPREGELLPPPAASNLQSDAVHAAVFYGENTLAVLDLPNLLQQGGWTLRDRSLALA